MKTYSEAQGKKPFNWYNALIGEPAPDWDFLETESGSWVTCACGNQCDIIPRSRLTGAPVDSRLKLLGEEFYYAVKSNDASLCLEILAKIEQRSAELIKEITNNNKS